MPLVLHLLWVALPDPPAVSLVVLVTLLVVVTSLVSLALVIVGVVVAPPVRCLALLSLLHPVGEPLMLPLIR